MSWLPVVSQLKSLVQVISGGAEGARRTQKEFVETCPVVSQVTSLVHAVKGDKKKARETQKKFGATMGSVVDSIPVVGHAKGAIHYACGDKKGGHNAMNAASRTTATVAGGAVGFMAGGPVGTYVGGLAGGQAYDGTATAIASAKNKSYTPKGSWSTIHQAIHGDERGKRGGPIFDAAMTLALDAVSGRAGGEIVRTMKLPKRGASEKLDMRYKVNRAEAGVEAGFKVDGTPDLRFADASRNGAVKAKPVHVPKKSAVVAKRVARATTKTDAKLLEAAKLLRVAAHVLEEIAAKTGQGRPASTMTRTQIVAAKACNASYKDAKERCTFDDYEYQRNLSDAQIAVWKHLQKKEVLVAFRGSTTARDFLVEDVAIVLQQESWCSRFESSNFIKQLQDKYPGHKLILTGHSLGGRIAIKTAMRFPTIVEKIVTFNEGTASERLKLKSELKQKLEVCRVPGDFVSANWTAGRVLVEVMRAPGANCHTISNFLTNGTATADR